MGMTRHDAYVLLIQGADCLSFLDGLSTNLVTNACTTVFTDRAAKIIDVCEVLPMEGQAALIGYLPHKERMVEHLSSRILGQNIGLQDITHLNDVFIGTGEPEIPDGATVHEGHFGTVYVIAKHWKWEPTWNIEEWNEHRITNMLPYHGHEITPKVHPLACGLGELVHENKGCFLGQEVLTRMRSRGKQGYRLEVQANPVETATTVGKKQSLCIVRDQ